MVGEMQLVATNVTILLARGEHPALDARLVYARERAHAQARRDEGPELGALATDATQPTGGVQLATDVALVEHCRLLGAGGGIRCWPSPATRTTRHDCRRRHRHRTLSLQRYTLGVGLRHYRTWILNTFQSNQQQPTVRTNCSNECLADLSYPPYHHCCCSTNRVFEVYNSMKLNLKP